MGKIYGVDLPATILNDDLREEEFINQDIDGQFEDYSFDQLLELDVKLQAKYRENGVESFTKWKVKEKRENKRSAAEFEELVGKDMHAWGKFFGKLNIGRLEELRQDITNTHELLVLEVTKMSGQTKPVQITVKASGTGLILGSSLYNLAVETTVEQLRNQAVYPIKVV